MFNQKFGKWSFLIASVLILAACGEVGPSPSLSSSSASSSTPNSSSSSSSSPSSSISSSSIPSYLITFVNYDDSVLSTQTVNQGTTAVYSGPTPTRESTAQYTYTFFGWDKPLTNITSSFTTIALYSESINGYTITWQNHDGTVLETDNNVPYGATPTYDGASPIKIGDSQYSYSFNGWSPTIVSVSGNATYIAQFTQTTNTYTITWQNHDGTVLETDNNVPYGATPTYDGTIPTRNYTSQYTYTFTGWSPAIDSVTTNATYTAEYSTTFKIYTITWQNHDGMVLETDTNVLYGTIPTYDGETPVKSGDNQYSYSFTGWSPSIISVSDNATYIAQFSQIIKRYKITWQNHDGTVLETDNNVLYGSTPMYNGRTPTKSSNNDYDFIFSGWSPEVSSVVGNTTYIAQFSQNLNYIPITTAQELNNIRNNLSGNYRLMNDIDLESNEWIPIGTPTEPFIGRLDGKNFSISNLRISTPQVYVGLFGHNKGIIKNLNFENVDINVTALIGYVIYGSVLVGYNNSDNKFENIHLNSGNLRITSRGVGYIGGLVAYQTQNIIIENSSNSIDVVGIADATGGLIGFGEKETIIRNSNNSGEIRGGRYVGGLAGLGGGTGLIIESSINNGIVHGGTYVGGLGGLGGTISDSVNYGEVRGGSSVGGLAGVNASITESINYGSVYSTGNNTGGLVGNIGNTFKSINYGSVNGISYVGGLVGLQGNKIIQSINQGIVLGFSNVGGLIGQGNLSFLFFSEIINSINFANINASDKWVGGLAGSTGPKSLTISNSYNLGNINGSSYVGGLLGVKSMPGFIFVSNSVNFGYTVSPSITNNIGGVIGFQNLTSDDIHQNIFYSGNIITNEEVVVGVAYGTKVTDLSTFNLAFFTTTLGWDTEIWDFTGLNIANGVYPTLKNMPELPVEE
jgi:hypothetical protein